MNIFVIFGIGVAVGCILTTVILRKKAVGMLRVDTSDPDDNPYLFLELSKGLDDIYRRKYVVLKVYIKSFLPQK